MRAYELRTGNVTVVRPREFKIKYDVDHLPGSKGSQGGGEKDGTFLIVTNEGGATEMRVMVAPEASPSEWKELLPYDKEMKIDAIEPFKDFLAIEGRQGGLTRVWGMKCEDGTPKPETLRRINFDDDAYEVGISVNKRMRTRYCRVSYSSLARPTVWYDIDM